MVKERWNGRWIDNSNGEMGKRWSESGGLKGWWSGGVAEWRGGGVEGWWSRGVVEWIESLGQLMA